MENLNNIRGDRMKSLSPRAKITPHMNNTVVADISNGDANRVFSARNARKLIKNGRRNNSDEKTRGQGRAKVSRNMNHPYYISQWIKNTRNAPSTNHSKALSQNNSQLGVNSPQERSKMFENSEKRGLTIGNKLILKNFDNDDSNSKRSPMNSHVGRNYRDPAFTKDSDTEMKSLVSPNSSLMSKLNKRLKNRLVKKNCNTTTVCSPTTKVSDLPFTYKTYNTNKQICEFNDDFKDLKAAEMEFKRRVVSLINLENLNLDSRENLICKIKKICDTFELRDETFYTSVMLNDFQMMDNRKIDFNPTSLDKLFDFSQVSNGTNKFERYTSFFKCIACIIISIKFCEHEKNTPFTREVLEFFELDGLTPILILEDDKGEKNEDNTIKALYKYIFEQQIYILLLIDFKINPVSLRHFVDHYCLVLPRPDDGTSEMDTSGISSLFEYKKGMMNDAFDKNIKGIKKREQASLIQDVNTEIRECIHSICNLSPLLPDFCLSHFSEISVAALCVTVSFSFKCLAGMACFTIFS